MVLLLTLIASAIKKNVTAEKKKKRLASEFFIQEYQLHITERQIKDILYTIRKISIK